MENEYLFGLPVLYYMSSNWWLRAAPGIEIVTEEENENTKSHVEFLSRIGSGYEFHFGQFSLTPSVNYDFVRNHDALVFGLNLGLGF